MSFSCGDGCYEGRQIYDPRSRKFLDTRVAHQVSDKPIGGANVEAMWLAPDASGYVSKGQLVVFGRGVVRQGNHGGGWLGRPAYVR